MNIRTQIYFDVTANIPACRDILKGKREQKMYDLLTELGLRENDDFLWQAPIGEKYMADFLLIRERLVIELDGKEHNAKKDRERDLFYFNNGYEVMRASYDEFEKGYRTYKFILEDYVREKRRIYNGLPLCTESWEESAGDLPKDTGG